MDTDWAPYPTEVNPWVLVRSESDPAAGNWAGVTPVTGLSNTPTARSYGSLWAPRNRGSACHVPQYVVPDPSVHCESNVTATSSTPWSQCAAVRKTVGEMSVPLHGAHVPSEYACGARSAPTFGWSLPSGWP
jgi:hypothetical protein